MKNQKNLTGIMAGIDKSKNLTGIMAGNTNIAVLPGGRVSVIVFDQPIDVLLISF